MDFNLLGLTDTSATQLVSCEPAFEETLVLNVEAIGIKALEKSFDLHDDVTVWIVDCIVSTSVLDLLQDLQVGLDPWVLALEDEGILACLQNSAHESDD